MRTLITIAIIIFISALVVRQSIKVWDKIVFSFNFKGIDLSSIDLNSLIGLGQTQTKLLLGMTIKNDNSFSIPVSNAKVFLYYDNTLIAESSEDLKSQSFVIPSNGSKQLTDNLSVNINSASGKLAKDIISKKNPKINYTVKIRVFGIPLSYSDYFTASV